VSLARGRHRLDDEVSDLRRELVELLEGESAEIGGAGDGVEQHPGCASRRQGNSL
jgi:hypothetical protein